MSEPGEILENETPVGAKRKRALRIRGLRQRWALNTIAPVSILLLLIVTLLSAGIASYYYASMQKGLEARAQAAADSFNTYFMTSYSEYYQKAANYADSFEDRDRIELQFISASGRIQMSASNLTVGLSPGTDDITQAIAEGRTFPFQGKDPLTKESILAVSTPLVFNNRVVGVMRFVTSLRAVNRQILFTVLGVIAIAAICMALVVISSMLFINNVVEPVAVVSEASGSRRAATASRLRTNTRMSWGSWWTTSTICP